MGRMGGVTILVNGTATLGTLANDGSVLQLGEERNVEFIAHGDLF